MPDTPETPEPCYLDLHVHSADGSDDAGAASGLGRNSSGTITVEPQNWHVIVGSAPPSSLRVEPQEGHLKTWII